MTQFANVPSRYGAPMGRDEYGNPDSTVGVVELFRIRLVDGDYDDGGAYWGGPGPLYCIRDTGGTYRRFVRASSWGEALKKIEPRPKFVVPVAHEELDDSYFEEFVRAYIRCALFTTLDDTGKGEYLDENYTAEDISPLIRIRMADDCRRFLHAVWPINPEYWTAEQAGHDFWYTRHHHGVGFWDRYNEGEGKDEGERLSAMSRRFGEFEVYVEERPND